MVPRWWLRPFRTAGDRRSSADRSGVGPSRPGHMPPPQRGHRRRGSPRRPIPRDGSGNGCIQRRPARAGPPGCESPRRHATARVPRRDPTNQQLLRSPTGPIGSGLRSPRAASERGGHRPPVTGSAIAPWTVVRSNDKKRGRIAALRWLLSTLDYRRRTRCDRHPRPAHRRPTGPGLRTERTRPAIKSAGQFGEDRVHRFRPTESFGPGPRGRLSASLIGGEQSGDAGGEGGG
jgi:Polyphosphate kinase 2 (PPK2)